MTRTLLAAVTALMILGAAPRAEAKIFEIWGSALTGYTYGHGTTVKDFYKHVNGFWAGAEVGVKLLFIGLTADYQRFFVGVRDEDKNATGNLITVNLGGDWTVGLVGGLDLEIRVLGGFYYGTIDDPPTMIIDNVPVESGMDITRGVGARAGVGLRYSFAKILAIGIRPQIGYHYFFGSSRTSVLEGNSHGADYTLLAYFRIGGGF